MSTVALTSRSHGVIAEILQKPIWNDVDRDHVAARLETREIRAQHIRELDEFLTFRASLVDEGLEPDAIRARLVGFHHVDGGLDKLRRVRRALLLIFDEADLAAELAETISAGIRPRPPAAYRRVGRALTQSIAVTDLPVLWQRALEDMKDGLPGEDGTSPAPEIVKGITRTMRQIGKIALDEGLPIDLTTELASAYERSLKRREDPLSPWTIKKYLEDIKAFARYLGAEPEFQDHIADRHRRQARRAEKAPTRLDFRAAKVPDFQAVLSLSFDMLAEARETINLNSAHALRNRAAAIALVSPLPLRIADLTVFFGRNITWNGEQYHLHIPETSKKGHPYNATIHPVFGHFIDQLVLHERPSSQLENAREACLREGRALFVNRTGEPVHRNYVSTCWWNVFGTGSHVARAKIHDQLSRLGPRGVELALAACGHRSDESAEPYRSRAFDLMACDFVRDSLLSQISDEEWKEFFT
ncbi:hypothetical protein [Roseovarius sp.]|uniref:hypothetical protein n=1 Tax=Roseovarius sp. TaxID=1486281 RepID=UPI0035658608